MKITKALKMRIYPNKEQALKIDKTIGSCRYVYNHMCFDSKIIAWKFGPAVPEAYRYYAEYGRDDIPNQEAHKTIKLNDKTLRMSYAQPTEIDYMTQKIIRSVVDSYSNIISPLELSRKTRNEDPWKTTSLNHEITCDAMHSYYTKRSNLIFG